MPQNKNILKLKQILSDSSRYFARLNPQQRRLALIAGGGLLLVLIYLVVISPLWALHDSWSQELAQKRQLLEKYQSLVASKSRVEQGNKAMKEALAQAESQFLTGGNSAVASADLQEIVKRLTQDNGVLMTSAKVLQPKEAGPYLEVPVQVQLSCTTGQLLTILYQLEHHKKLLFIPELEVNAPRWAAGAKGSATLQVNLVISGVIKKSVGISS
ncbi:MAG: type II secretion system protein GspM [Deltaproteobacteria bacterium]|nr:type II secretion system protein GspM [Deltaproteobacteria bacterium]